jgi:hypothetical protein
MKPNDPSRTALLIARQRAAHQLLDHGSILNDPFAMKILHEDEKDVLQFAKEHPLASIGRLFTAARSTVPCWKKPASISPVSPRQVPLSASWKQSLRDPGCRRSPDERQLLRTPGLCFPGCYGRRSRGNLLPPDVDPMKSAAQHYGLDRARWMDQADCEFVTFAALIKGVVGIFPRNQQP